MVATVRCEEIANEKFSSFIAKKEWCQLEETVQSQPVHGFGRKLTSIESSMFCKDKSIVAYVVELIFVELWLRNLPPLYTHFF